MQVISLCNSRWRHPDATFSPLLIPSFSSRGFSDLQQIHATMATYVTRVSLLSAYDMAKGLIPERAESASDLVFVDSGGYESKPSYDSMEGYHDDRLGTDWTIGMYRQVLSKIQPVSEIVIVNFDEQTSPTTSEQIASAHELFGEYPKFSGDFLWKPEAGELHLANVEDRLSSSRFLGDFRLLGVTDKELGESLVARCRTIAHIRTRLTDLGLSLPIHIFGCLDPLCCILYFMCGADVFDGLSWLRYLFLKDKAVYHGQGALLTRRGRLSDNEVVLQAWTDNLEHIKNLQQSMAKFAFGFDHVQLGLSQESWSSIVSALEEAEISMQGVT